MIEALERVDQSTPEINDGWRITLPKIDKRRCQSSRWSSPLDTGLDNDVLYFDAGDRSFTVESADLKSTDSLAVDWEGSFNQATEDMRAEDSKKH